MSRASLRILVADATGTLAPVCVVFLAYWGHEVEVVHDGLSLARRAQAWLPDLVIADDDLDGVRAPALVGALRSRGRLARTRFLLVVPPGALPAPVAGGWSVPGPLTAQALRPILEQLEPPAGAAWGDRREPA